MKDEPQIEFEDAHCPLCGESELTVILTAQGMDNLTRQAFGIAKCSRCDLLITNPRPAASSMERFYEGGFYETHEKAIKRYLVNPAMDVFQRIRLKNISRFKKTGSLLDVGSGKGKFLDIAARSGWEAWGIEPSQRSRTFVQKKHGVKVFGGKFEDVDIPDRYFDVVTMWHTLEHFYNPLEILERIRGKLKDDGILVVRVPNCDSWDFRLGKEKWFQLDVPRHLYHFSPKSLSLLFNKAGFQVFDTSTSSFEDNPMSTLQTMMSVIGFKPGAIYRLLKEGRGEENKKNLAITLASLFAGIALSAPSILFSSASQVANQGGTLTFVGLKKGSNHDFTTAI